MKEKGGNQRKMDIKKAARQAIKDEKFIARKEWNGYVALKVTDTVECCSVYFLKENRPPVPRWEPRASDLLANDWICL